MQNIAIGAYYQSAPTSPEKRVLMRWVDELLLKFLFAGAKMLSRILKREGQAIGRRRVSNLMKLMNVHALYCKPNGSQRHAKHPVYPYLLRTLSVIQSNHVWAADITYILMRRDFVYLFAVVDWVSRRVLSCRLSN